MASAVKEFIASYPAVRLQHRPDSPVGKGLEAWQDADGSTWLKSLIVDEAAKRMTLAGVLAAYSVGLSDVQTQKSARAPRWEITDFRLTEVSLVDSPSNARCGIEVVSKSRGGYVGQAYRVTKSGKVKPVKSGPSERELLAIGGAAARDLGRAWDLNSDDPFTRELAHLTAGSPAVSKAAGGFVDKALRSGMMAALDSADPVQREMARKALGGRRG